MGTDVDAHAKGDSVDDRSALLNLGTIGEASPTRGSFGTDAADNASSAVELGAAAASSSATSGRERSSSAPRSSPPLGFSPGRLPSKRSSSAPWSSPPLGFSPSHVERYLNGGAGLTPTSMNSDVLSQLVAE